MRESHGEGPSALSAPPRYRGNHGTGYGPEPSPLPGDATAARSEVARLGRGLAGFELARENFDDPKQEWRRLFSEVLGTFFLVLVGAGGGVVNAASHGAIPLAVARDGAWVDGAGDHHVHGRHQRRAPEPGGHPVFAARGDFPWRRVPGYIVVQLLGSTLACLFLWAMFGKLASSGATEPGTGFTATQAMWMEMILTVGLVSVILGTASAAQNVGPLSAIAVGAYIILAGFWSRAGERRVDEPRPLVRARPGDWGLLELLGLHRRADRRRTDRGRLRVHPPGPERRRGRQGRTGRARPVGGAPKPPPPAATSYDTGTNGHAGDLARFVAAGV